MTIVAICQSNTCQPRFSPAEWVFHWPGRTAQPSCHPCLLRAIGIAKAMGFQLPCQTLRDYNEQVNREAQIAEAVDRLTGEKTVAEGQGR